MTVTWRILQGDVCERLASLPAESVQTCVTSPPYWGLRDYGTATWDGGDPSCDHDQRRRENDGNSKSATSAGQTRDSVAGRTTCRKCGARRIDAQIGLEPTPSEYVTRMVEVFAEVHRVLREDGTLWVNLGDSYNAGTSSPSKPSSSADVGGWTTRSGDNAGARRINAHGLKPKDLVGIPWSVAKALQAPRYTGRVHSESQRVWLAATIDAEGSICGFQHERKDDGRIRTGIHITITNTSTLMLDEANRIWPASRSEHQRPGAGHLGTMQTYRWIVHGIENKIAFLREIYPHLIVKRGQAVIAYNMLMLMADAKRLGRSIEGDSVRERRADLMARLSRANHGSVDVPTWCVEPPTLYEPGWYLRSEIIWHKPNPMPESVTDRPTKSHEQIFLFSKSARYYYDAEAIAEQSVGEPPISRMKLHGGLKAAKLQSLEASTLGTPANGTRNKRSVWTVATQAYPEAHFATYPEALIEPCILAGTSERGQCPACGAPWQRVVERELVNTEGWGAAKKDHHGPVQGQDAIARNGQGRAGDSRTTTLGWQPSCGCDPIGDPVPQLVLDPFTGSGTTGAVAIRHQRSFVGTELNPAYIDLARRRIGDVAPLLASEVA